MQRAYKTKVSLNLIIFQLGEDISKTKGDAINAEKKAILKDIVLIKGTKKETSEVLEEVLHLLLPLAQGLLLILGADVQGEEEEDIAARALVVEVVILQTQNHQDQEVAVVEVIQRAQNQGQNLQKKVKVVLRVIKKKKKFTQILTKKTILVINLLQKLLLLLLYSKKKIKKQLINNYLEYIY